MYVALAVLVLVAAAVGFLAGRQSRVITETVECSSAVRVIQCTLEDGWTVSVPLRVGWSNNFGTSHPGQRPACLPPSGIGLEGPVEITWTEVEVDGRGWRQVLWVGC